MRLQPGDMQFVHNHTVMHDRTEFRDWPAPKPRRHLLRLWLSIPGDRRCPKFISNDMARSPSATAAASSRLTPS